MLAFLDPLDEDDVETEPSLAVEPLPGAMLEGRPGAPAESPYGDLFAVSLQGADSIGGVRLALSGDALALLDVDAVTVTFRVRGAHQLQTREMEVSASPDGVITVTLDDAFLERVDLRPPALDPTDMFATMQRLMSAGETQQLNTLLVSVSGLVRKSGQGMLELTASSLAGAVAAGEGAVPVRFG
jgi:hypothetical protein